MKHIKTEDHTKGCPNTHMRDPIIREAFEGIVKTTNIHLDLHMKDDAPHYSSKETRISYTKFKDGLRNVS